MNPGKKTRPILLRILLLAANCSLLTFLNAAAARAHDDGRPLALRAVDFEQKLGEQAPLDAEFRDETGKTVRLGDYFGVRPVILTFAYYRCQDLCPLLLDGVLRTLRALSFTAGKEFEVVNISFDPHDTPALAAAKKSDLIQRYARPGAADGWHFLSGGESSINRITEAAGFRYNYESDNDRFAHATGIMLLTPQGRFARYFYGVEFSPRDLRLGLLEASDGKIGKAIDQLLLFCYHYDPATGKYTLIVTNLLRGATIATVLALGAFIALSLRGELSRRAE
ncbi:MAG TPA: SCO family protein [Candidatus Binatia bacterium]|nr:SCO family protein [Candidatus Binatia bacterium]